MRFTGIRPNECAHLGPRSDVKAQSRHRCRLICTSVRSAKSSMTNCQAEVVAALDRASALPSLVVFDLDYTLWPYWCEMKQATDTPHLYPEARQVLDALRDKGVRMAVASRTPTPPVASAFLQKLGISSGYFESVQLIPWTSANAQKDKAHFPKIQKETGIPYSEMLFFDDESPNIARVSKLGVTSFLVSEAEGVSCRSFTQALQQYAGKSHR